MRSAIIHELPDWRVTSYGNGMGYELANKPLNRMVYFQGDDAAEFREQLEAMTERTPALDYADAFAVIWSEYGENAGQWEDA